jgi:hypothetical protein
VVRAGGRRLAGTPCLAENLPYSFVSDVGECTVSRQVKAKVPLRPKVSRSVRIGVEPRLGLMTRCYVLFDSYGFVSMAPSLTIGRVCHLSLSLSVY